jgi:hypothetical protein
MIFVYKIWIAIDITNGVTSTKISICSCKCPITVYNTFFCIGRTDHFFVATVRFLLGVTINMATIATATSYIYLFFGNS